MKTVAARCPVCGCERQLRPADARRAGKCRRCHLKAIAPKGWEATSAKYGPKVTVHHLREYRLKNPSALERRMMDALDELGAEYEREAWIEADGAVFLVDFLLPGGRAIEINGSWAHQFHSERDARKREALEGLGYKVTVFEERALDRALSLLTGMFS